MRAWDDFCDMVSDGPIGDFTVDRNNSIPTNTHIKNVRTIVLVVRQSDRTGFRRNGVQGMKGRGDAQPLVRPNLVLISFGGEWTMMNQPTAFIDNE